MYLLGNLTAFYAPFFGITVWTETDKHMMKNKHSFSKNYYLELFVSYSLLIIEQSSKKFKNSLSVDIKI